MLPLHTGQRVQLVGSLEFATVEAVNPHNYSLRLASGEVREFGRAWILTGPDEDCDPFDNCYL
jgi:hypothetical protein